MKINIMPQAGIEPTSLCFMSKCDSTFCETSSQCGRHLGCNHPTWRSGNLHNPSDVTCNPRIETTLPATTPFNLYVGYTNVGDPVQFLLKSNLQGKLRGSERDKMFKDNI